MKGAEGLVRTMSAGGVRVCFTNPGTTEMNIVAALDRLSEIRCVLALFEGVATGAADGYARMAGAPPCTLLHLGPGLANGLANLHNAKRAEVPIVNIVGQHATFHLRHDTPLTSDIEALARPFSKWLRISSSADVVGSDMAEAIAVARGRSCIATLIVPADVAWDEGGRECTLPEVAQQPLPSAESVGSAALMLRAGLPTAILLSGNGLYGRGLIAAGRIAAATGAHLLTPYPFARLERGAGRPRVERIPYVLEQAVEALKQFRQLLLVGASRPLAYFAYPGKSSELTAPECKVQTLSLPSENSAGALEALADELAAGTVPPQAECSGQPLAPTGPISLAGLADAVAVALPEDAIVVDESMTSGRGMMAAARGAPPHDWLANTGGSIGIALPLAIGAAIASPGRRVLCLSADGSGLYTAQALWTIAREGLPVTTVILNNRMYGVVKREFLALGVGDPGEIATSLYRISNPDIDWMLLSRALGVPAERACSLDEFLSALRRSFAGEEPALIEVVL